MTTRVSDAARNAQVNAVAALLNGGTIRIYSGAQPASVATAASGTLLATLTLSATAFAAAESGSATANAIASATAAATGTAGYFRVLNSSGTAVLDGSVTATGGGDMVLNSTSITSGGTVNVTSWVLTV